MEPRPDKSPNRNQMRTKTLVLILAIWFALALVVSSFGFFRNASAPAVAGTVWGLTAFALFVCWFRALAVSESRPNTEINLRWLIVPHLARFVGVYFLILGSNGQLPNAFARPAGVGDILTAAAATLILVFPTLRNRPVLFLWNTFGLVDIILVVFLALRSGLRDWLSMAPLREFPLSLLPTFVVPIIITSHLVIFIRLARSRSLLPTT